MKKTDNQKVKDNTEPIIEETKTEQNITEESNNEAQPDKVAEIEEGQVAIWQDKYARLSAEFDNFRKRTVKEKMELITNGGEKVLKSVIEIADDFERAMKALDKESSEYIGIELISKKLNEVLKSNGVTMIDALGKPLDVDFHEAIAKVPTGDSNKEGIIIDVVQNGYMLNDKVLRFAKVVVSE